MVLRSQMARQGIRWRYMSGGSRRTGMLARWRWGILSLIIILAVGMVIWLKSSPTPGSLEVVSNQEMSGHGDDSQGPQPVNYTLPSPTAAATPAPSPAVAGSSRPAASASQVPSDRVWTLDGTSVTASQDSVPVPASTPVAVPVSTPTPVAAQPSATPAPAPAAPGASGPVRFNNSVAAAAVNLSGSVADGFTLIEQGKVVEARKLLSKLLVEGSLTQAEAQKVRDILTVVNNRLIYSPRVTPGDPLTGIHVVQRGDRLVNIAIKQKVPHQFIEKINGINADRIQLDQKIKVVNGPFHAVVTKSAFRMDIYLKDPADGQMLYIRSFPVGLGTDDSTPLGDFVIRPRSKVVNPGWTNPRTGETFSRDDPKNPIGEFWMALEGVQAETANLSGYGIHGTIEPDSIGTQSSMGCVRLRDEDIAQVYYLLWEGESTVKIVR
jgi:LysM repeat protein